MEFKRQNRPVRRPPTAPRPGNIDATHSLSAPGTSSPAYHKKPARRIRQFLVSRPVIIGLLIIGGLAAGLVTWSFVKTTASAQEPTYETVLPRGKPVTELGGWKRISPPGKEPVFAFADTIDGVAVSVSQQPLPEQFKENLDARVAELAQKFNATEKVSAGEFTVYIGTSSKGPQSVIFAKNNLLILIKSEKAIKAESWTAYARSLR